MGLLNFFISLVLVLLLSCTVTVSQGRAFTLAECVALALENNPDLHRQQLNLELAHADMAEQKSRNFGKLDIVSSYTRYNLPHTLAPMTPASISSNPAGVPTTEDLFSAGLAYEIPLFTGFARTRAIEIAALQKEMAAAALKLSREQLVFNVKTLYVSILSLQAREAAQAAYVKALQRLADDMARQVKLGSKARIDQLKAAADLKKGQAVKSRIAADIRIMKASLASLLNVDHLPELRDIDLSPGSMVVVKDDFSDQLKGLQRMRVARLAIEKNRKLVEKARGALYPQLVLNSFYGQNFGPNDDRNKNSGSWEKQEVWQAALKLKWNIFDFGTSRARVRKAGILERQSRYEQTGKELELRRALQEAVIKINAALTDYNSAGTELAMTRETAAIEQVRFDQGAADISDLLHARARNQLAESRFINAGYNYKKACFYLDYLLEHSGSR